MIKRNKAIIGVMSAVLDMILTFVSYILAVNIRFDILDGYVSINMKSPRFIAAAAAYSLVIVLAYAAFQIYKPFRSRLLKRDIWITAGINLVGMLTMTTLSFVLKLMDVSRFTLFIFWMISTLAVDVKMVAAEEVIRAMRAKGKYLRHVVVIGNGKNAALYINDVRNEPKLGIVVDGYLSRVKKEGLGENLGSYEDIGSILESRHCDEIVVALEAHEVGFMRDVLMAAEKEGTRIEMIPFYNEYFPRHPTIESLGETTLVDLRATPLDNILLASIKRLTDIICSFVLIVILSPLLLIIAAGVKLSSPGPVFFRQERIGKNKKPFSMLKFRSMRVNDEEDTGWSTKTDPRRTRFGSFIRKYSLDELPQLFNVLIGQMSLVGPRPEIPFYVRRFKEEIPLYLVRQQVRPGMTGWAQIHGLRGDTSIEKRVEYDIWYIQNWTIGLDINILLKTAFGGMKNQEALGEVHNEACRNDKKA